MEEALRDAAADDWRMALSRSVQAQRQRARELLTGKQARVKELEAQLEQRLDALAGQLAEQQSQTQQAGGELAAREAALAERAQALSHEQQTLAHQRQAWDQARQAAAEREEQLLGEVRAGLARAAERHQILDVADRDLQRRAAAMAEREAAVLKQESELNLRREQLAGQQTAIEESQTQQQVQAREHAEQVADLRRQQHELAAEREQIAQREQQTQRQRRHIAQQLRAKRQELSAEAELHRAEALASSAGEELQLQMRLSELQAKHEKLRDELAHRDQAQVDAARRTTDLERQLAARQHELVQQHTATEHAEAQRWQLQAQVEKLQAELSTARENSEAESGAAEEVSRLRAENQRMEKRLATAEQKAERSAADGASGQQFDDLRRRFDMALQDLRELKTKNAELGEQLEKANDQLAKAKRNSAPAGGGGGGGGSPAGGLDWEAQKRRLLEQLENDFDESDEAAKKDKLTVQGAIKITDEVVAERDKEIEELRQLLENQSQSVGDVAVGAAAIAQMFDSDELLCQQREHVQQLEASLREQLKKAEVDISLERAKLARERAELDEKLRQWQAEQAKQPIVVGDAASPGKGKNPPARGKWLARLGLGEGKDG